MADVSIGSTVMLKSGGPLMTADAITALPDGTQVVSCVWFDGKEKKSANYRITSLKPDDGEIVIG